MLPLRDPFEPCGPALHRIHTGANLRRLRAREHRFDRNAGPDQSAELTNAHPRVGSQSRRRGPRGFSAAVERSIINASVPLGRAARPFNGALPIGSMNPASVRDRPHVPRLGSFDVARDPGST